MITQDIIETPCCSDTEIAFFFPPHKKKTKKNIFLGNMEACVLGSGHPVLYWPFCYKNRAWLHCFQMAWKASAGMTSEPFLSLFFIIL